MCSSIPEDGEGKGEGVVLHRCCGGGSVRGVPGDWSPVVDGRFWCSTEGIRPPLVFLFLSS
jgi:hypothetical protein